MKLNYNIPMEEVSVAAYYVWENQHPYEILCWFLAERELYVENNFNHPRKADIRKRAYFIFTEHPPYDLLCWFIGKLNIYIKQNTSDLTFDTLFSG